jgi:hypothetical protein
MGAQVHFFIKQMSAFANASQTHRVHLMTLSAQNRQNVFPTPSAMPCAMNQNILRHNISLKLNNPRL